MQKGAYYIMVMNMTVMVRPWDVEDAMEMHSLSMHPYYLKKKSLEIPVSGYLS